METLSGAWFGKAATAVDEAGNCAGLLSRLWNGGCFVPGTLVTLSEMPQGDDLPSALWANDSFLDDLIDHAGGGTALLEAPVTTKTTLQIPIEDVPLGARVPTKNPRPWEYDDGFAEPDEATWSKVNITAKRKDGQIVDAEILRPTAWLQLHGIIAGNTLPLNIPELQIDGEAHVETTEPCPPLASGEGSVVTARFITRQVDHVATVEVLGPDGNTETLTGTTIHPVWSVDRQSWVELAELREGERLQAAGGDAIVVSVTVYKRSTPVYNIEVHGEHVYQVGQLALLVHNACRVDVWNIGEHVLQPKKNWASLLKSVTPTLDNIRPFIDDVVENGTWNTVNTARGRGGEVMGEIVEAVHDGVYIRGLRQLDGTVILNNAGVL